MTGLRHHDDSWNDHYDKDVVVDWLTEVFIWKYVIFLYVDATFFNIDDTVLKLM